VPLIRRRQTTQFEAKSGLRQFTSEQTVNPQVQLMLDDTWCEELSRDRPQSVEFAARPVNNLYSHSMKVYDGLGSCAFGRNVAPSICFKTNEEVTV